MKRRTFLGALAGAALTLVGLGGKPARAAWEPKPGDLVEVLDYPDPDMLRACSRGVVKGPISNPEKMNGHYLPHLQLWSVCTGLFQLQCYAHEMRPAGAREA